MADDRLAAAERRGAERVRDRLIALAAEHPHVVDGIESGLYPAIPERPGWSPFVPCQYCEPDGLGRTERWIEWQHKRHDPRLARWFGEPVIGEDVPA